MEERQQGEGESASETSENVGGVGGRGFLLSPHHFNMKEEEESEEDDDDEEEGGGAEEFTSTHRPAGQSDWWFAVRVFKNLKHLNEVEELISM